MNAFMTALSFLTRIPVPMTSSEVHSSSLSKSIIFFPLVGGIIGFINAGVYMVLEPFLPIRILAVFIIAVPMVVSGGIHFDGLLDTCDGIFSGRSKDRILEIMRDSRVGSMGVIAGILSVLLRYSLIFELPGAGLPGLIIAQAACGRWIMSGALYFFPYARKEGGLGQSFNIGKRALYFILSTLMAGLILFSVNGAVGIYMALGAGILSLLFALWVAARIGGLTGDVYGALNEIGENIFLLLWLVGIINFHLFP